MVLFSLYDSSYPDRVASGGFLNETILPAAATGINPQLSGMVTGTQDDVVPTLWNLWPQPKS